MDLSLMPLLFTTCRGCYIPNYGSFMQAPYIEIFRLHQCAKQSFNQFIMRLLPANPLNYSFWIWNVPAVNDFDFHSGEPHTTKANKLTAAVKSVRGESRRVHFLCEDVSWRGISDVSALEKKRRACEWIQVSLLLYVSVSVCVCGCLTDDPDGGWGVDTTTLVAGGAGVKAGVLLCDPLDTQRAVRVLQLDPWIKWHTHTLNTPPPRRS